MLKLDTESFLINPRFPEKEKQRLLDFLKKAPKLPEHIWMATSGSTGHPKWVALSKQALVTSAQSVNEHLASDRADIWLNPLPSFHVGGLGIEIRAGLSGAKVINLEKWDPLLFHRAIQQEYITLSSLVPAQVYDLVIKKLEAPDHLRGIVIGGGALSEELYKQASQLNWPLLPSYGLTECASQVATAPLSSVRSVIKPALQPLKHVQLQTNEQQYLKIKSASLLSLYGIVSQDSIVFVDPKADGWFQTEDKVNLVANQLEVLGRDGQFLKIGGESSDLTRLEQVLQQAKLRLNFDTDAALAAVPEERLGYVIHLCAAKTRQEDLEKLLEEYHKHVLPFERIRKVHILEVIPRTVLGKPIRSALLSAATKK